MTVLDTQPCAPGRSATTRNYLMCRPEHFAVTYAINAWMDPTVPVDRLRALAQWDGLKATYEALGHRVEVLTPVAGLPDMVFAANGATVFGGRAYGARFAFPERFAEAEAHARWLRRAGWQPFRPTHVNEGEGDFVVVGPRILAGTGFRTSVAAHAEAARVLGAEVVTLELVDPRFYHLDTALAALDDENIAYYEGAFARHSLALLRRLYPAALLVCEADALVLGLNFVSDGLHVLLPPTAGDLAAQVAAAGYRPIGVDVDELRKAGGGIKCCTMELRG